MTVRNQNASHDKFLRCAFEDFMLWKNLSFNLILKYWRETLKKRLIKLCSSSLNRVINIQTTLKMPPPHTHIQEHFNRDQIVPFITRILMALNNNFRTALYTHDDTMEAAEKKLKSTKFDVWSIINCLQSFTISVVTTCFG